MRKVIEYQVVNRFASADLSLAVNDLIKQGWQPLGGVCRNIVLDESQEDFNGGFSGTYAQAMGKYEESSPNVD